MKLKQLILCLGVCYVISSLNAQVPEAVLFSSNQSSENQFSALSPKDEMADKRSLHSAAYKTDDGRIVYKFSKAPINYQDDNGQWSPINLKPRYITRGSETIYGVFEQNYPMVVRPSGELLVLDGSEAVYTLKTDKVFGKEISNPVLFKNKQNEQKVNLQFTGMGNVHGEVEFRNNGMKLDYVIENPVDYNVPEITQQLICDKSFTLSKHKDLNHALSITNSQGEEVGMLYPIVCTDANGNISTGEYTFNKTDYGYEITLRLDKVWLSSSSRSYPVTVDPLITGPTAVWTGGVMPSCLVPNYNVDSLEVTIPGTVMVTGVFVSGHYYADPFAGAVMSEGEMYFSSSCGQTGTLTVPPPAGNTPGWGHLDSADYRSPLTCCLGQDCSDRTFWVRMHLGRTAGGAGCTSNYIYYDPLSSWPFTVYVEGRSAEATSSQWTVLPASLCSDDCELTMRPFLRYGVPPYTITHPWASGSTSLGSPINSCALTSFNVQIPLTRPNCPEYCDTTSQINIPFPTITDACGTSITGLPIKLIDINPTPEITVSPTTVQVCSGDQATFTFDVCPPGTQVDWSTPGFTGTNTIDTVFNVTSGVTTVQYTADASLNGCNAVQQTFQFEVSPNPTAGFSFPNTAVVDEVVNFVDSSDFNGSFGTFWGWTFGDGNTGTGTQTTHAYTSPGTYNVCLFVTSEFGCMDTICDTIQVIPAELKLPNVLSMNDDGMNDVLYFQYLDLYGTSHLSVFNRWGEVVFESADYQNDWEPTNIVDGTYYYIISLPGDKVYTSTLTVFDQ